MTAATIESAGQPPLPPVFTPLSRAGAQRVGIEPTTDLPPTTARLPDAPVVVLAEDGTRGAAAVRALAAAGLRVHRPLTPLSPEASTPWPVQLGGVVAVSGAPADLADIVDHARRHDPEVAVVLLADRADGRLLGRLLGAPGGHVAYGLAGDDPVELLARAAATPGCATSPTLVDDLLGRLGGSPREHDLHLVATLLAGGGRAALVAEVERRPELLASLVDDAAGRALKRLALGATTEDRSWLAHLLDD